MFCLLVLISSTRCEKSEAENVKTEREGKFSKQKLLNVIVVRLMLSDDYCNHILRVPLT